MEKFTRSWEFLSLPLSSHLTEAIRQVHQAAQMVALLGDSLLPKAGDDSQSSMHWNDAVGGLLGMPLPLKQPARGAFVYETFELKLVDGQLRPLESLHLLGQTRVEVLDWLREAVERLGGKAEKVRPIQHFTLPPHPLDSGAAFQKPHREILRELARYRHNADGLFREITAAFDRATEVRIWPHHFDTGLVLSISLGSDGQATQSIGIGLAMPDDHFDEPYFYVNHWSVEDDLSDHDLPDLPGGGHWHRRGWTGAVLEISRLLPATDAREQREQARRFLQAAVKASLELLGRVGQEIG